MWAMVGKEGLAPQDAQENKERIIIPPWLTRSEWFDLLGNEQDRGSAAIFLNAIGEIFKTEFRRNQAKLYAVGSTALPVEFRDHEPNDIDVRLVLSKDLLPSDGHDFYLLQKKIETTYNSSAFSKTKALLGDFRFDSEETLMDYYGVEFNTADFNTTYGRSIQLFLPYDLSKYPNSLEAYEDFHGRELKKLMNHRPRRGEVNHMHKFYERHSRAAEDAYIVPLTS